MRIATCSVVLVLASAAATGCGNESGGAADASVDAPRGTPIGFTFEAIEARSFASFGWTGLIHNVRVPERTPFGVAVTGCESADGICNFVGPTDPKGNNVVNRKRCLNHTRTTCQSDMDCGAPPANKCVYIYDPPASNPLTGMGGKVGACGWSYIPIAAPGAAPTISGTLDLGSSDLNLQTLTIVLPQNGVSSTYRGACAECIGDDTPNDGKANGTCMAARHGEQSDPSPDIGLPCDTNRSGTIPGFEGDTSMDCSPTVKATDGPGSAFGGTFLSSGYVLGITADSPDCTDAGFPGDPKFPGRKCFCGMCSDGSKACLVNKDCPAGITCGGAPANCNPNPPQFNDQGVQNPDWDGTFAMDQCRTTGMNMLSATRGNSCRGGICDWNPDLGTGTCISLINNQLVGCYPSGIGASVVAPGGSRKQGNVYIADTANARCTRLQLSPAVNGQLGLPGLTFQRRAFRIIPEYPE